MAPSKHYQQQQQRRNPPPSLLSGIAASYRLALLAVLLPTHLASHAYNQTTSLERNVTTDVASSSSSPQGVGEILKDTIQLLDSLDERLAMVTNRTQSEAIGSRKPNSGQADKSVQGRLDDEELTSLAEGFSSERRAPATDMLVAATAPHPQVAQIDTRRNGRHMAGDELGMGAMAASGNQAGRFDNDFTERHIRFSLDLMRALFASQLLAAKSQPLESFLISPVSLQLVLMMMHLGARGATKRELSHTLHLLSSSPVMSSPSGLVNSNATTASSHHQANLKANNNNNGGKNAKLTRRHQQQQQSASRQPQAQQSGQSGGSSNNVNAAHQQQQLLNNVHEQFGAALRQLLKDPSVAKALTSANQIFLQRDLPLAPHYEWAVKHYYGTELRQVDFQHQDHSSLLPNKSGSSSSGCAGNNTTGAATSGTNSTLAASQSGNGGSVQQMINEWVERQTRGKISNFLSLPVPTSTLLMALNVLFFKGDWQYKFDPQDTDADAWFTQTSGRTVKMPMMVNKLPLAHAHDPVMKTSIIELPYKAQRLGLFVLLPDATDGIFETMQQLNSSSFANLISMMRKPEGAASGTGGINVRLPKFSIDSSPRMSQILSQQLGLKALFSPDQADLSGMFGATSGGPHKQAGNSSDSQPGQQHITPLQVGLDELLHKAVLQVHEQGSVAAAASATIVERVGLFNGQYFEADHPFLLFLMDKQTGLVLFSGAFAGPAGGGQQVAPPSAANDHPPAARGNSTSPPTPGSGNNNNNNISAASRGPKSQQQQSAS